MSSSEAILIADDEEVIREMVTRILDQQGHPVFQASDGFEALQLLSRHSASIRLLITDLRMPRLGGLELAATVTHLYPALKVIIISGSLGDLNDRFQELSPNTVFLEKPFEPQQLLAKVRSALDATAEYILPLLPDAATTRRAMNHLSGRRYRILVVDDEERLLEVIQNLLEEEDFEVLTATAGDEGLRLAESRQPDLVLLDLKLPDIGGFEVCKLLKGNSETLRIPIVILTSCDSVDAVVEAFEAGASDYILKPFNLPQLSGKIRANLDLHASIRRTISDH